MRVYQALRYGSVRWKYIRSKDTYNPRGNLLKPLVGSAVIAGMGLGMGTALCEDPPQLMLFSDGAEPLLSERNKTKMYLDDLLTSMEQDDGLKQASRSDLPAELSVVLKTLLASENVDYDIYIRILKVISRLSEKQAAALKFLKTDAVDSIYEVLKDVVGWPWDSGNYAKKMFHRLFLGGTDNTRLAEKTPQGVLLSELCSKILANIAKVALDYHPFVKDNRINLCNRMIKLSENVETRRNMLLILACIVSKEGFPEDSGTTLQNILEFVSAENPDPVSQWYATGGLRNMCKNSSMHKNLVLKGAIPALVNVLLTSPEPKAQALAASAVADLSTSAYARAEVIRVRMVDSLTFEALGRVLKSSNQGVLRSTSKAIDAILSGVPLNDRARQPIVDQFKKAGVPGQITRLSLGRLPPVVSAATSCLYTLAAIDGLSEPALEAGAARVIIGACNSFDPGMASRALDALAQMSESSERADYLVQAGVLRVVLAIRSTNPVITYPLTILLANLTRKEELRAEVAHEGGLVLLNAMLTSGNIDEGTKKEALRVLHNLSVSGLSRVMVVQYGSLLPLIENVKHENAEMKLLAVKTLSNLMEGLESSMKAFETGGLAPLIACGKEDGELGCRAVLCVGEFTNLQELHSEIVRQGGVELFANVIRAGRSSEAVVYAVLGLCNLAASEVARERIREAGAIGLLNSVAHTMLYSGEIAAVAEAGLANLQKGEKTMIQVLPASPSKPL